MGRQFFLAKIDKNHAFSIFCSFPKKTPISSDWYKKWLICRKCSLVCLWVYIWIKTCVKKNLKLFNSCSRCFLAFFCKKSLYLIQFHSNLKYFSIFRFSRSNLPRKRTENYPSVWDSRENAFFGMYSTFFGLSMCCFMCRHMWSGVRFYCRHNNDSFFASFHFHWLLNLNCPVKLELL